MASIRKNLHSKGISERAIDLILNARKTCPRINYEKITNRPGESGIAWCHTKQTNPINNQLSEVLDFLSEMFELGFEYSTINTHRSSIAAFHNHIVGFSVRKRSKVCNLMTYV